MNELKSLLPPADVVQEQQSISIFTISLGDFDFSWLKTRFEETDVGTDDMHTLTTMVHRIDDPRVQGYIPSKLWSVPESNDVQLLYYTSPTLPPAARPFGDKPCYAFLHPIKDGVTISYPIDAKVLIDQLLINDRMYYLFLFPERELKNVLTTTWEGEPWATTIPEAELYTAPLQTGEQ